jgi:ankyrin repeat protein
MALDNRQWTPLHYASYNGHPAAVNFLLKWEADFDKLHGVKNSQGRTAFIISKNDNVKKGFNRKFLVFINKCFCVDIWKSCKKGDLDMTRIMIREGQHVNEKTQQHGNSALHIAARYGHYLIVKYLLDIGAAISQTNTEGKTPK